MCVLPTVSKLELGRGPRPFKPSHTMLPPLVLKGKILEGGRKEKKNASLRQAQCRHCALMGTVLNSRPGGSESSPDRVPCWVPWDTHLIWPHFSPHKARSSNKMISGVTDSLLWVSGYQ